MTTVTRNYRDTCDVSYVTPDTSLARCSRPGSEMVHSSPEHRTPAPAMGADLAKLLTPEHRNRLELSRSVQELSSMFTIVTQADQAIEDNTGSNR